eukprot:gnl/Hemi2/18830_TR6237_c0_g1_i1.p1 gnl/Hemi2/18830_TR6237_c0_g1~~gnl/Hemi2/18830_TR6237_c0_g1_i1.p1  ORF type:complete len:524 (-),score=32.36 gnl/Hemi2/18830_TR6237_c0_g1_i1:128-1699(-)
MMLSCNSPTKLGFDNVINTSSFNSNYSPENSPKNSPKIAKYGRHRNFRNSVDNACSDSNSETSATQAWVWRPSTLPRKTKPWQPGDRYPIREIEAAGSMLHIRQDTEAGLGGETWDCSLVLAKYLERCSSLRGKRAVELGAGTGVVSVAAVLQGAHVVATDQAAVLDILRTNLKQNMDAPLHRCLKCCPTRVEQVPPVPHIVKKKPTKKRAEAPMPAGLEPTDSGIDSTTSINFSSAPSFCSIGAVTSSPSRSPANSKRGIRTPLGDNTNSTNILNNSSPASHSSHSFIHTDNNNGGGVGSEAGATWQGTKNWASVFAPAAASCSDANGQPGDSTRCTCSVSSRPLGTFEVAELNWGQSDLNTLSPPFDFLLGSDLFYGKPEVTEALIQTMVALSGPQTVGLICHEQRNWGDEMYFKRLAEFFSVTKVPREQLDPVMRADDIDIFSLKKLPGNVRKGTPLTSTPLVPQMSTYDNTYTGYTRGSNNHTHNTGYTRGNNNRRRGGRGSHCSFGQHTRIVPLQWPE